MQHFILGEGKYVIASASHPVSGVPRLTLRRLNTPVEVGTISQAEPNSICAHDLIIDVLTPEAAACFLTIAQAIAFHHGVVPTE